jgi:putative flippase GtrA
MTASTLQHPRLLELIPVARRFASFFVGSLAGLVVDLGGFAVLVMVGVQPGVSNLCSSFASISVVYLLVTRFTFGVGARPVTYIAFVAWYSTSVLVYSGVIVLLVAETGLPAIACKLMTVPVSFAANYAFSRVLFRKLR